MNYVIKMDTGYTMETLETLDAVSKENIRRAVDARRRRMFYCWILTIWHLRDIIEGFKPSFFQHPLSHRCTEEDCHRNVPLIFPGIPRTLAEHGRAICRKCFFTCVVCEDKCPLESKCKDVGMEHFMIKYVPIVVDVSIVER